MHADSLPQIRVLDDQVCNQIAAGEVIERPASVLKELVENSVDAGATEILVEILQGGRKAVMITDNGCGMNRDSCLLAIERHATSKIRDAEDIERIHSMGFRGEALAAITSVSRFTLESRPEGQLEGTRVHLDGGKLSDISEVGCPVGTRIEVRNLFYNTPARRKFLRAESTELAYIRTFFQTFAIAHPDVALRLQVDGRVLQQLPAQPHLADRIADLQGQDFFSQLHPVDFAKGELHIHGFIGLPTLHRSDRRDQVTLINRRPATAPLLGYAIRQAYSDSLPSGRHPVLFLHLEMPAEWVDVNVHPTKREVRFGPSHLIRDHLIEALSGTLETQHHTAVEPTNMAPPEQARPPLQTESSRQRTLPPLSPSYPPLPPKASPPFTGPESAKQAEPPVQPVVPNVTELPPQKGTSLWEDAVYLGVQDEFHLLSIQTGVVMLYPRAARERILVEQVQNSWEEGPSASQRLLIPESISCSAEEARRIREHLQTLTELGFALAEFDSDTFMVEAVPAWLKEVSAVELLHTIATDLEKGSGRKSPDVVRERLARSCCRLAASHQKHCSAEAAMELLRQLAHCHMPYTTPFGKPTLLHLSTDEFRRKFGFTSG